MLRYCWDDDGDGGQVKKLMFSFFAHKSTGPGTTEMMMVTMVMMIVMVVRSAGRVGGGW